MEDSPKSYQPGWGEKKKHHHHHHHGPNENNRGWGGALRMKDKQAYYGLMFVIIVALGFGAYKLIGMFVAEFRAMPNDDPTTEMNVDELDIRRVEKQEALMVSDSIAKTYRPSRKCRRSRTMSIVRRVRKTNGTSPNANGRRSGRITR